MPGFLYHMEPRGDRLIGLGFDRGNAEGSPTVSLFDMSDLATPTMLDRVNFGGDWGSLAEDQDRIHKAFNVLDEIGTILVPYSGYDYDANGYCGDYNSGVQIIDYAAQTDDLTLRGSAKARGQARRGFMHDERLFTVSDERVQSFDIADRDAPAETASVTLTTNVTKSVIVGDHVVRLTSDWWTSSPHLEVVTLADAASPVALGELDLGSLFDSERSSCYSWSYPRELLANDSYAYLIYDTYAYYDGYEETKNQVSVVVIDVSEPTAPSVVAKHSIIRSGDSFAGGYGYYTATGTASPTAAAPSCSSARRSACSAAPRSARTRSARARTRGASSTSWISNPSAPKSKSLQVPVGLGNTGLVTSGNVIALSHYARREQRAGPWCVSSSTASTSAIRRLPRMLAPRTSPELARLRRRETTAPSRSTTTPITERVADYNECYEKYGWSAQFDYDDQANYTGPGACSPSSRA